MKLEQLKHNFPLYLDQTIEVSGRLIVTQDEQYLIDDEGYVLPLVFTETLTAEFRPNVYTNSPEQNLENTEIFRLAIEYENHMEDLEDLLKLNYTSPNVQVAGRLQKSDGYFLDDILHIRNLEMLINPRFEGIIGKHTVDLETSHHSVPAEVVLRLRKSANRFLYGMMSYHRFSTSEEGQNLTDIKRWWTGYLPSIQETIGKRIETHAKLLHYDTEDSNHIVETTFSTQESITVTLNLGEFGKAQV